MPLLADVEDVPEVDEDADTDGGKGEEPDHLAAESAGKVEARREEPEPPHPRELAGRTLVRTLFYAGGRTGISFCGTEYNYR